MQTETENNLVVRRYAHNSSDDKKGYILRHFVLNLTPGVDDYTVAFLYGDHEDEAREIKIGAFVDDRMVGTLCLTPQEDQLASIRQFAVFPDLQGMGIGRKLLDYAHATAKELGCKRIYLDARQTVVAFYAKAGYVCTGKTSVYPSVTLEQMYIDL